MKRWTPRRKAVIIEAILARHITVSDACEEYGLSKDEIDEWAYALAVHGLKGLRSTKGQRSRKE